MIIGQIRYYKIIINNKDKNKLCIKSKIKRVISKKFTHKKFLC